MMSKKDTEKASEYYAHNYFDMHETNSYKELKRGFEAGVEWAQKSDNKELLNDFLNWHDYTLGTQANKASNERFIDEYLKENKNKEDEQFRNNR